MIASGIEKDRGRRSSTCSIETETVSHGTAYYPPIYFPIDLCLFLRCP